MSRPHTVVVCTTLVPLVDGGAEAHAAGLVAALRRAGHEVALVALPFSFLDPERIVHSALAWRLLDLTQANGRRIDLLIALKFPAWLVAHPNKVVWVLHQYRSAYDLRGTDLDDLSPHPDGPGVRRFIQKSDDRFLREARRVFANSRTVAERLRRFNGIDCAPLYHPPPLADRLRPGAQGDYVFFPGRVDRQKRQRLLIEAMRRVRTPVRLLLAGDGPDAAHCEELVARHGLAPRVRLLGRIPDEELLALYAGALAVAYPAREEDLGYVPLEGMACAKPVLVTADGGGATEFVRDGDTGRVVPADPEALAEALDDLYDDQGTAARLGRNALDSYHALGLSWTTVVERLVPEC